MSTRALVVGVALLLAAGGALVATQISRRAPVESARSTAGALYQCPMHPQIVAHEPGLCPICQMPLQRVDDAAGPGAPAPPRAPAVGDVPGHAAFTLSPERQQLIGVTSAPVERRPLSVAIRAAGRVAYDPALYQAVVEYREALRARHELGASRWPEARAGADALVRGATLRLRQQGISEAQVREMAADPVNLLLPGKSVWVYAQVYEYEVELVHAGQEIAVTAPSLPGRAFRAIVTAIDPILDTTTRTVRVRALVATPDASLRPEAFVNVTIDVPLGERLAVPEDAVLDTGEHQIVFVVSDEGRFEPRAVRLGREAEGHYEVLGGLEPGERVVTSANFLIDSESRFRAALAAFGARAAGGHAH